MQGFVDGFHGHFGCCLLRLEGSLLGVCDEASWGPHAGFLGVSGGHATSAACIIWPSEALCFVKQTKPGAC